MSPAVGLRIGLLVFAVSIFQVSVFSVITAGGGGPDVLLVTLVSVALLRGAVPGSVAGFAAGLVVDLATLATLGLSSLLLTLAGYWAGRYGETTGRGRPHAPVVAVIAATTLVGLGGYGLHAMLGEPVSVRAALVSLPASLIWNAVLVYPVFGLVRRVVGTTTRVERAREVELLV